MQVELLRSPRDSALRYVIIGTNPMVALLSESHWFMVFVIEDSATIGKGPQHHQFQYLEVLLRKKCL